MGNLSACCSVEESSEKTVVKENITERSRQGTNVKSSGSMAAMKKEREKIKEKQKEKEKLNDSVNHKLDLKDFQAQITDSIPVIVLLQDGTKLACTLHLDMEENARDSVLSIRCEDKVRSIPMSDIKSLLYSKDQLKRVETKANLVDDQNCVALHLQESGNCIPLQFKSTGDKELFVELIKKVKDQDI